MRKVIKAGFGAPRFPVLLALKKMYEIIEVTKDYFKIIKTNAETKEYDVDLALKTCTCGNFQFQTKEVKKKYKCKHFGYLPQ